MKYNSRSMGETKKQAIDVRSLCGESAQVSVLPDTSIRELKLLLKQSFLPASSSPNFHLYLKGSKLSMHRQVSSYSIRSGEFIVIIPFIKKDYTEIHYSNESGNSIKLPDKISTSDYFDVAWSSVKQDMYSLGEISCNENQIKIDQLLKNSKHKRDYDKNKQGRWDDIIFNTLEFARNNSFGEQNFRGLILVLESTICLSDRPSRDCMLTNPILRDNLEVELSREDNKFCRCPSWLKMILKSFFLLNILSACSQVQQKDITWGYLEEALGQLEKYGLQLSIEYLKHVSVICPKVVHFASNEFDDTKVNCNLIFIKPKDQNNVGARAKKQVSIEKAFSGLKKREKSFGTMLWSVFKSLMLKCSNYDPTSFSLEDVLIFANKNCSDGKICSPLSHFPFVKKRCHETNRLLPMEMINHLRSSIGLEGQIVHIEEIASRAAIYQDMPKELSETTMLALKCIGINKLYSHQAESFQASLACKNVVVATMTSSGKSLCYNLPVLEALSQNLSSCALYLFPTKALAQDQLRALLAMTEGFYDSLNIGVYDGDTSSEDRTWFRDNARLLITNPDMLHVSILPFHKQFSRFLLNLRFVVIDEAHAYKGAFGCHTSLILRRLRRICSHVYGSNPSFIFCTATSANPRKHAMELANLSTLELIQNDGSPSASKLFVLWNPALCLRTRSKTSVDESEVADKAVVVKRSSPIVDVSCIFAEMVQHGLRCIVFCKSRKLCELVLSYTHEILQKVSPRLVDLVCAYRAGYVAQDRRRIENNFFSGKLYGIVATNALELGIDVGHIDVTLHLGFPGTVASLWQQAGRSGRRDRASLAVYVAFDSPLDQYFMKFPHKLFRSPIECCHIDAQNQQVLEEHLVCAASEHPLALVYDEDYFGPGMESAIISLKKRGYLGSDQPLNCSPRLYIYIGHEKNPSHAISIRAIEAERYKVINNQNGDLLEEIEESKAFFQVYDGAVYMHQGKCYLVKDLDVTTKIALCQEADLKYYTKTRDYTDIHVVGSEIVYPGRISKNELFKTTAQAHTCKVTTTWFGFRRIWKGSNQVFDTHELSLPSYSYQSQAVWIRVPQSIKTAVEGKKLPFRGGLHAASHAVLHVLPLYVICNSSDLASECFNPHDARYIPERILIYDQHPGGIGITSKVQPIFSELLAAALDLLTSCACPEDTGCPNCVQSLACREYNEVLHKDAGIMIIKGVIDAERVHFGEH